MPVNDVVALACVRTTVAPVSSVTVIDAGVVTDSLIVAVILIATAALYEPSDVVEENDDTVGAVVSVRVTVVDFGEAVKVVRALPAVSVIENVPAAVSVDTTATPSAKADDVAVTVHTVDEV